MNSNPTLVLKARRVDIRTSNAGTPNIFQGGKGWAGQCPVTLKMPLHVDHFTLGCPRIPTLTIELCFILGRDGRKGIFPNNT